MQNQKERICKACVLQIAVHSCSKVLDSFRTSELTIRKFLQQFSERSERAFCESKQASFNFTDSFFSKALLIQKH
jgi:hypothetical protein